MEQILSDSQTNLIQAAHNREYRDRLFKAIFGRDNELSKKWRLELYNALNNTSYTDPDALEVNTIENVIYMTMKNDISFLVDSQMTLYEQQSTYNPNMPLRGFFYFSQLYQMHIEKNKLNILGSKLIKIPEPRFVVFYNGDRNKPDTFTLRLSDAFERRVVDKVNDDAGKCKTADKVNAPAADFEWTATVININPGRNSALQKNCKPLYDYVRYVGRITDNQKSGMPVKEAVDDAVCWAIDENLLDGFFSINKAEVIAMCLTEFDVESAIKTWREDGYEDGRIDGKQEKAVEDAKNLLKDGRYTAQEISSLLNIPVETFSVSSSN
ncbi:MAG: hypothetical protein J5647_10680 [Spirochaetaceae bacterium]|nr:hypothetical protein [Spirochaetaceae bacterium]